jgi:hypothetical protein
MSVVYRVAGGQPEDPRAGRALVLATWATWPLTRLLAIAHGGDVLELVATAPDAGI